MQNNILKTIAIASRLALQQSSVRTKSTNIPNPSRYSSPRYLRNIRSKIPFWYITSYSAESTPKPPLVEGEPSPKPKSSGSPLKNTTDDNKTTVSQSKPTDGSGMPPKILTNGHESPPTKLIFGCKFDLKYDLKCELTIFKKQN